MLLVSFPFDPFGLVHTRLSALLGNSPVLTTTLDGAALVAAWLVLAAGAVLMSRTSSAARSAEDELVRSSAP
jgi:hypothetical protein